MSRNGVVYVSKPSFFDEELRYASINFAKDCGVDFDKFLADQAYFFLRDISHTHQHHDPFSDTILMLQPHDERDIQWRKNIVYCLNYGIINSKRSKDALSLARALGIHAYCQSFESICVEDDRPVKVKFNNDALKDSLDAKLNEYTLLNELGFSRSATRKSIYLAFVGLMIAVIAILVQPHISDSGASSDYKAVNQLSIFVTKRFVEIIVLILISVVITWANSAPTRFVNTRIGTDVFELSNLNTIFTGLMFMFLSIVTLLVTFALFGANVMKLYYTFRDLVSLLLS